MQKYHRFDDIINKKFTCVNFKIKKLQCVKNLINNWNILLNNQINGLAFDQDFIFDKWLCYCSIQNVNKIIENTAIHMVSSIITQYLNEYLFDENIKCSLCKSCTDPNLNYSMFSIIKIKEFNIIKLCHLYCAINYINKNEKIHINFTIFKPMNENTNEFDNYCNKCGSISFTLMQVQSRSADEACQTMMRCLDCYNARILW